MAKTKLKKRKRKWFVIKAPDFKNIEVTELLAYEIKDLIGRKIKINYNLISENIRDQKLKIKLVVTETKGSEGIAKPEGFYLQDSFVNQRIKRDRSRGILVIEEKTKDNKDVKVKFVYSSKNKVPRSINSKILKQLEDSSRELIKKTNSSNFFDLEFIKKETNKLKENLRKIYPIDKFMIWKLNF